MGVPSADPSVFQLDETELDNVLADLHRLDTYLEENPGTTYADLQQSGSELIMNVSDLAAPMGASQEGEAPLGIPAFWWGCILGWVGILLVYLLTDNDKAQTKKALNGCLISTGVGVVLYVIYVALLVETTNSLY